MYLLHYTWVKWNGFLAHTSSLICSQIWLVELFPTSVSTSTSIQVSFLLGVLVRICKENLYFHQKIIEIWLINTGHMKTKGVFYGTSKMTNNPAVIFFLILVGVGGFYYCIIPSHYLQVLAEVLQNSCF